jgi:hypothetical protein
MIHTPRASPLPALIPTASQTLFWKIISLVSSIAKKSLKEMYYKQQGFVKRCHCRLTYSVVYTVSWKSFSSDLAEINQQPSGQWDIMFPGRDQTVISIALHCTKLEKMYLVNLTRLYFFYFPGHSWELGIMLGSTFLSTCCDMDKVLTCSFK